MGMPTIVGIGAANSGAAALTASFPVGYTAVDLDIAWTWIECENADTITPPSGWTLGATQNIASGTTTKLTGIYRRLVAGDTAPLIADAGDHMVARMIVVRGCKTSGSPINISASAGELVADTTVSIPGGTTTQPNCLCMAAFSTGQDVASTAGATGWANPSLANVTERMDNWATAGLGGGFAMATGEASVAGVYSATTATLSLTANFKALIFVALEGAAGAAFTARVRRDRPVRRR